MTKPEVENRESAESSPKEKAIKLITSMYEMAAINKGFNNWESETAHLSVADGMGRMAVELGIITMEEATTFIKDYFSKRAEIPQVLPPGVDD